MQGMNLPGTPKPRRLPEQTAHRLLYYRVKDMPTMEPSYPAGRKLSKEF